MPTQKNNPIGNDWTPPAAAFGSSPVPTQLVPPETAPTLLGWNQDTPSEFGNWTFAQSGYQAVFTQ